MTTFEQALTRAFLSHKTNPIAIPALMAYFCTEVLAEEESILDAATVSDYDTVDASELIGDSYKQSVKSSDDWNIPTTPFSCASGCPYTSGTKEFLTDLSTSREIRTVWLSPHIKNAGL